MDLIGRQFGNYVVQKLIGAGGMGSVYLCEHPLLGRLAALKVLHEDRAGDPATLERFFHEAKAANAIQHPNIVEIFDFGLIPEEEGQPSSVYLLMEFLNGTGLVEALPTLSIEDALHITRQCCRALAASHQGGIVHRDLKPDNIFLARRDNDPLFVKLLDFGIAKLTNPGEGGQTKLGTIIGTPAYMSPEQCDGRGLVDHRADIYSLGVVLYQMLTGRLPFEGSGFAQLAIAHMIEPPTPPSQLNPRVSPDLDAVVLFAMEKARDKRFQQMDDFRAALDDPAGWAAARRGLGEPRPVGASAPTGPAPPAPVAPPAELERTTVLDGRPASRGSWRALAAAAAAGVVAGGAAMALVLSGSMRSASPVVASPPPVAAAVPRQELVSITIETEPAGAMVKRGGLSVGLTPITMQATRGDAPLEIDVTLDGFTPDHRVIATDTTRQLVLMLRPLPVDPSDPAQKPGR